MHFAIVKDKYNDVFTAIYVPGEFSIVLKPNKKSKALPLTQYLQVPRNLLVRKGVVASEMPDPARLITKQSSTRFLGDQQGTAMFYSDEPLPQVFFHNYEQLGYLAPELFLVHKKRTKSELEAIVARDVLHQPSKTVVTLGEFTTQPTIDVPSLLALRKVKL